ncbi:MAG: succinate dehydrogenase, cytochrome b556 subunit [Pseudohongiellaceae bacterium]
MNNKRPVNLDIFSIRFPLPAITSILHRVSGAFLLLGIGGLLYLLDMSLASEAGFAAAGELLAEPLARIVLWLILTALAYHFIAGCKHLLMDMGIAEGKASGNLAARLVLVLFAATAIALGVWLW